MKIQRILHVYGQTCIESYTCPKCKRDAFVFENVMSCCGAVVPSGKPDQIKVEIDKCGAKRHKPPKREQERILEEQDYCCFYCDEPFPFARYPYLHWDHIIPFVFNGNNDGYVAACPRCNIMKGSKMFDNLEDAKAYMKKRI